jgi:hypothetical protein
VCAPVNIGELNARVFVSSSSEEMWSEPQDPPSPIVAVEENIKINTRLEARGFIDKYRADGQNEFHILRATAVPEDEDEPTPPAEGGNTVNPVCLIWDLVNDDTGQAVKIGEIDVREIKLTDLN